MAELKVSVVSADREVWSGTATQVVAKTVIGEIGILAGHEPVLAKRTGLILDLRSEGYAALGPIPDRPDAVYLRVVSEGADGRRQALNHFNKAGKGELARKLLTAGIDHPDAESLLAWAGGEGIRLEPGERNELALVV